MSESVLKLSICICTLDRVHCLGSALESLARESGIEGAEVLVVNNAETDRCQQVLAGFSERLRIRYLQVPERSLGVARNRGWQEAVAPLVAYIDDDAELESGWLSSVLEGFSDSGVAALTGPVLPAMPYDEMPSWLPRELANAIFSLAPERPSGALAFPGGVIGNNMAFRRSFLEEVGGFSSKLQNYDEAFVAWQAHWRGYRVFFHSGMRVRHAVDLARLEPARMRMRPAAQGVAYQKMLEQLQSYPAAPSRHGALWGWLRPLAGLVVSQILRDRRRILIFESETAFAFARLQHYFGLRPTDDFYEKPSLS